MYPIMKPSGAAANQVQGTLLSRSLDDFLDSSGSESEDSFACDEEQNVETSKNFERNFEDPKKRPSLVGMIKKSVNPRMAMKRPGSMIGLGSMRQGSMRSLFGNTAHAYQEELHSERSDSEDDEAKRDRDDRKQASQVNNTNRVPNRQDLLRRANIGHQTSMRSLLSKGTGKQEEQESDSDDEDALSVNIDDDHKQAASAISASSQPNRRQFHSSSRSSDALVSRSCHGSGSTRKYHHPEMPLSSRSMHNPRRSLARNKSDPGEINIMASAMVIEQDRKTAKMSESSGGKPCRGHTHRSRSDPGEIRQMEKGFRDELTREKRRGVQRSKSTSHETPPVAEHHRGLCDHSLSSHGLLSDVSSSLHPVGEYYHGFTDRVPVSITCGSNGKNDLSSESTSPTDFDLSEYEDEIVDSTLDRCSTHSRSSRKSTRRPSLTGNGERRRNTSRRVPIRGAKETENDDHKDKLDRSSTHSSSSRKRRPRRTSLKRTGARQRPDSEKTSIDGACHDNLMEDSTVKEGVTLPGQFNDRSADNERPASLSLWRRQSSSHAEEDSRLCTFNIDGAQPLLRGKHRETSEFMELNISCHDGESVASLASIGVQA